uniref:Insulin-like growth factor-binding protein complex acid labile subunit n=1 Tax=Parasteatoda tepidariorum TaxID=114398 RepID=A0A2L2YLK1_PARTP
MWLFWIVSIFSSVVYICCQDGAFEPPEDDWVPPSTTTIAPTEPPHVFCPTDILTTYPCTCEKGGTEGLTLHCENANLAMMALGLGNVKDKLINSLLMTRNYVRRLKGSVLHNITISNLEVSYNKIEDIDGDVFDTLGESLVTLNLEGNNLKNVPSAINKLSKLQYLNLANNQITVLPANAFSGLPGVKELRLDGNKINKIFPGAFNNILRSLDKLHLQHNKIQKFERNVFKQMVKLKYLDISYNDFSKFAKTDFTDLTFLWFLNVSNNHLNEFPRSALTRNAQLRVLNASNNNLKEIDAYLLRGLRLLRDLYLAGNKIKTIAQRALITPTRLRTLDLARNSMQDIGYEMFKDMNWLERLDLSYNKISRIASNSFIRMFQVVVDLSHNNISFIGKGAFVEMSNVTVFDLSYNSISEIAPETFQNSDVNELRLDYNNITDLSKVLITNLTGIKIFNVTHNKIDKIDRKSFSKKKLYELHTIDLSYNNITEVSGNAFEKFGSIRNIIMHHNKIRKIGYGSFGTISTLLEIDISHNNISEVTSGGFTSLVSLRMLYINDNFLRTMFVVPIALNEVHIENNTITRIPPGIFPAMNSLLHLYLDYNNITRLERGSFRGLLTLRTLSLGYNNISEIPWESLEDMSSLQYLYLHGNHIKRLNRKAFGNLPVVFEVRLDFNNLQNVSSYAFEGMLQLISLNMSYNNISSIPPSAFTKLVSLQKLDISHNRVSSLENKTNGILEDLLSLEVFNASYNHLSFISDRSFPKSPWIPYKIKHIDLSHNFIPVITKTFDDGMTKVEVLKLQNNILNEIRPEVLSNLTYLRHLDLSGNELPKLPKGTFGLNLRDLEELDLSNNRLGSIDVEEVLSMKKLRLLDLRENRFATFYEELIPLMKENFTLLFKGNPLICNCHIRPLRVWISNQPDISAWNPVACHQPTWLEGRGIPTLDLEELNCKGMTQKAELPVKPDIKIRGSEVLKDHGLRVVWYVATREDVAGFKATLRNKTGILVTQQEMSYNDREYVFRDLEAEEKYELCLTAVDSLGSERQAFKSQCTEVGPVGLALRHNIENYCLILPICIAMSLFLKRYL